MNREEQLASHLTLCDKARNLMRKNNADYAGHQGIEPFANFTRVESMGICKTESGMLVRVTDKMSRLSSFMEAGKFEVKDESLEDTILDMINYSVLLYAYVSDKKKTQENLKTVGWNADTSNRESLILLTENHDNENCEVDPAVVAPVRNGCCGGTSRPWTRTPLGSDQAS